MRANSTVFSKAKCVNTAMARSDALSLTQTLKIRSIYSCLTAESVVQSEICEAISVFCFLMFVCLFTVDEHSTKHSFCFSCLTEQRQTRQVTFVFSQKLHFHQNHSIGIGLLLVSIHVIPLFEFTPEFCQILKSAQHVKLRQDPPLDLGFWSFLTFLHHGIEDVERHLL